MGRVRTAFIKRMAHELLKRYPDRFSIKFEQNREVVDELLPQLSKPNQNRIAGYISTIIKQSRGNGNAASS